MKLSILKWNILIPYLKLFLNETFDTLKETVVKFETLLLKPKMKLCDHLKTF